MLYSLHPVFMYFFDFSALVVIIEEPTIFGAVYVVCFLRLINQVERCWCQVEVFAVFAAGFEHKETKPFCDLDLTALCSVRGE